MAGLRPQSIARGFSVNMAARVAAAGLGVLQLAVLAQVFGQGEATDAWTIALRLPMLFLAFLTGPLHTTFIPVYVDRREADGEAGAAALVNSAYTILIPSLAVAAALFWLGAPMLIRAQAPGFGPERLELATTLLRWLAPLLVLGALAEVPAMLFEAQKSFTWPAIGSTLYAVGVVVFTLVLGERYGITVAAVGGIAGVLVEAVVLSIALGGRVPLPRLTTRVWAPGVGRLFYLMGPRMAMLGGTRLNVFVDGWFASLLQPAGVVTALDWGEKLTRIPLILFAGPLTRTITPVLSEYAARGEMERVNVMLGRYLRLAGILACACGAVFVFFPNETVRVFFRRGAFDEEAVRLTSIALLGYGVGMLAYAYRLLISTVFFTLQDTVTPMKWTLLGTGVNVLADWSLMQVFGHGGIALATAVVESVVAVGLYRGLRDQLGALGGFTTAATFGKCLFTAAVCGGAAWLAARAVTPFIGPPSFWRDLLLVAGTAGPAGVVYLLVLYRWDVEEVREMMGLLSGRKAGA